MTLVTYSDNRRFFLYKISPLFFDCFPKSWWSAPQKCYCDFKFAFISNHHWYIVCQIVNDSIFDMSDLMNSWFWEIGMNIPVYPVVVRLRNFSCCWPQSAIFDISKFMIYFSLYSSLILVWKEFVKCYKKTETLTQVSGFLTVAIFGLVLDLCTRM